MSEPERLTIAEQFDALDFDYYISRILQPDVFGVLASETMILELEQLQELDATRGIDQTARRTIISLLTDHLKQVGRLSDSDDEDASKSEQRVLTVQTGDSLRKLLTALQPDEVATLFDACLPDVESEKKGKAIDRLYEIRAEQPGHQGPDALSHPRDGEVTDSAMPFSEREPRPVRVKHLSPRDAERVAGESLRRTGNV